MREDLTVDHETMLNAAFVCVCLVAVLLVGLRRRCGTKITAAALVLTLIAIPLARDAAGAVPSVTEDVTITALGIDGTESLSDEVFISSFEVDGKIWSVQTLEVPEGKWIHLKSTLGWRKSRDDRQPYGVTESITFSVPVGTQRKAVFSKNECRGWALVSYGGKTATLDTSEDNVLDLGPSSASAMRKNTLLHSAAFCAVMAFVAVVLILLLRRKERWISTYQSYCSLWQRLKGWRLFLFQAAHYTLLFLIVWFLAFHVFPEAGKTFVWNSDGSAQEYPRFVYLRRALLSLLNGNGQSYPMYDFNFGIATQPLPARPLDWLAVLIPEQHMEVFFQLQVMIYLYAIGLAFLYFGYFFK